MTLKFLLRVLLNTQIPMKITQGKSGEKSVN